MKTKDAIEHFGGVRKLSIILKTWPQAIYKWGEFPPQERQWEIQVKSDGKLKAEAETE